MLLGDRLRLLVAESLRVAVGEREACERVMDRDGVMLGVQERDTLGEAVGDGEPVPVPEPDHSGLELQDKEAVAVGVGGDGVTVGRVGVVDRVAEVKVRDGGDRVKVAVPDRERLWVVVVECVLVGRRVALEVGLRERDGLWLGVADGLPAGEAEAVNEPEKVGVGAADLVGLRVWVAVAVEKDREAVGEKLGEGRSDLLRVADTEGDDVVVGVDDGETEYVEGVGVWDALRAVPVNVSLADSVTSHDADGVGERVSVADCDLEPLETVREVSVAVGVSDPERLEVGVPERLYEGDALREGGEPEGESVRV